MIDGLYNQPTSHTATPTKVLHMVKNERMGGFIPKWEKAENTGDFVQNIEKALSTIEPSSSQNRLGYAPIENTAQTAQNTEFGFGDLIDMVNPLQHLPVIGHLYRQLTGDEIKPIGQIMGGALFGGPLGAAAGLVNAVIEQETGKDVTSNAYAMVFQGQAPTYRSEQPQISSSPETRLAAIQNQMRPETNTPETAETIPGNLLALIDMKTDTQPRPKIIIERTAGNINRLSYPDLEQAPLPKREPITQVRLGYNYND